MGDVTTIQSITNNYKQQVLFINTEGGQDNMFVGPGQSAASKAQVPWCDHLEDFPHHFLMVSAAGNVYFIWQSGPYVWGSPEGWGQETAEQISEGGSVNLIISADFKISLTN